MLGYRIVEQKMRQSLHEWLDYHVIDYFFQKHKKLWRIKERYVKNIEFELKKYDELEEEILSWVFEKSYLNDTTSYLHYLLMWILKMVTKM